MQGGKTTVKTINFLKHCKDMETNATMQAPKRKFYRTKRQPTEAQLEAMRAKRIELKTLSKPFKQLVDSGKFENINEGLVALYASQGHKELKTLKQWNEAGKRVIKGQHALLLWAKPTKVQRKDEAPPKEGESKELEFFPVCFVFSNLQVEDSKQVA